MLWRRNRHDDEERRLRAWLHDGGAARTDRFRASDAGSVMSPREQRLKKAGPALLAGVALLVLVLVMAELSDSLIGHAGLLAVLVAIAALVFYGGFWPRRSEDWLSYYRVRSRLIFFLLLPLMVFTVYFGLRENQTVDELAGFITPVPGITDVLYVATGPELQAIAAALAPFTPAHGTPPDFSDVTTRYWKLETDLSAEAVLAFYSADANRPGWSLALTDGPYLELHRGAERMSIFVSSGGWDGEVAVWYILRRP